MPVWFASGFGGTTRVGVPVDGIVCSARVGEGSLKIDIIYDKRNPNSF